MTDPRITNILTPKIADSPTPLTRGEVALKIISTTDDLQSVRRPLRVEGQVISVAKDNSSATIQTSKGDVTVQLRNNTPLQQGQSVQIDIPAGQPPRQAIVRADPNSTQQPSSSSSSTSIQTPAQSQPTTLQPTQDPIQTAAPPSPQTSQQTQAQPSSQPQLQSSQIPSTTQNPLPPLQQPALPPAIRALLDQAAPSLSILPAPQAPTALPLNAIVRLIPLQGLPATTDLLPVPAAVQAFIESIQAQLPHSNPLALLKAAFSSEQTAMPAPPVLQMDDLSPPLTPTAFKLPGIALPQGGEAVLKSAIPSIPAFFDVRVLSIKIDVLPKFPTLGLPQSGIEPEPKPGLKSGLAPAAAPSPPLPLIADVVGLTKENFPIISLLLAGSKTPQLFTLQFSATNLPVGTQLEILPPQILPVPGETETLTPHGPTSPSDLLTGWAWPVLTDTMQALSQTMPQAQMAQAMANVLPSPAAPATLNSAVLFFIAAIQSGDLASWMGDKGISALRRDAARGGDILSRLTHDVEGLGRLMDNPVAQDWKGIALPLYWQNEIQKMHLFYRHQDADKDEDKENGKDDRSTRFLFDLNLTRMGDVQIDGLMKSRRLDVILRTGTPLSYPMQTAMRQKYLDVLETGNLSGDLAFQNRLDQWVRVKVETKPAGWAESV